MPAGYATMTDVDLDAAAAPAARFRWRAGELMRAGGAATFVAFAAAGAAILLFALATVHRRPEQELQRQFASQRSHRVITYWADHGYLASGGLMAFASPGALYRSSPGTYMLSGSIVERIAMGVTGRYQWQLLAVHNEIVVVITGAMLALLSFRTLLAIGTRSRDAFLLSLAVQAVFATFPDMLAQYWELGAQTAALPFALLVLLSEQAQPFAAFFVVSMEPIFGIFFLAAYCALEILVQPRTTSASSLVARIAAPAAAALLLFSLQLAWVHIRYPGMHLDGSGVLERMGLDGSTAYYRGHLDIITGRDVARANFPSNRESLFDWSVLFVAGVIATVVATAAAGRSIRFRRLLQPLFPLLGAYVLYAAIFSEAVVIHPYLYDSLIAVPLIVALFAFVPALIELRVRTGGVILAVTLFAAVWCAMVQMRHYAMWFPTSSSDAVSHAGPTLS